MVCRIVNAGECSRGQHTILLKSKHLCALCSVRKNVQSLGVLPSPVSQGKALKTPKQRSLTSCLPYSHLLFCHFGSSSNTQYLVKYLSEERLSKFTYICIPSNHKRPSHIFIRQNVELFLTVELILIILVVIQEAAATGMPVVRHLFLHYPHDENVQRLIYEQFLVGCEILVVPVLDKGRSRVRAYFPPGDTWEHIWTGLLYTAPTSHGLRVWIQTPIGFPALFVKRGSPIGVRFMTNLIKEEILKKRVSSR